MTVFWDIAPVVLQKLDDVSEVLTASIIRAVSSSETLDLILQIGLGTDISF
jgi:hypothetical protein